MAQVHRLCRSANCEQFGVKYMTVGYKVQKISQSQIQDGREVLVFLAKNSSTVNILLNSSYNNVVEQAILNILV